MTVSHSTYSASESVASASAGEHESITSLFSMRHSDTTKEGVFVYIVM